MKTFVILSLQAIGFFALCVAIANLVGGWETEAIFCGAAGAIFIGCSFLLVRDKNWK